MARYKERWPNPLQQMIIGYLDTDTGKNIPIADANPFYQEFLQWQAEGGTADPAYTAEEIAAYEAQKNKSDDIEAARALYGLNLMSEQERNDWLEEQMGNITDLSTPTEIVDAVNDVLKRIIVYL